MLLKVNEENVLSLEDEKLVNMYATTYHTNCNAAEQEALTLLANEQLPVLNVPTLRELGSKAEFSQMIRLGKRTINSWHEYTLFLIAVTDYVTCACCNTFFFELFESKHEWLRGIPSLLAALDSEWYRIFNFIHPTDLSMEQLTSVTKLYKNAVKRLTRSRYIHYMSGSMLMADLCLKAAKAKCFRSKNDMTSDRANNFNLSNSLFKDVSNVFTHDMKLDNSDSALNCANGESTLLMENTPPVPKQKKYTSDITKYMAKKHDRPLVNGAAKVYSIFDKGSRVPPTTTNKSEREESLITTNEKITVPTDKSCVGEQVHGDCLQPAPRDVNPAQRTVTEQDTLLAIRENTTAMDFDLVSWINDVGDTIPQDAQTDLPETQTRTDVNISTPLKTADEEKPLLRLAPFSKLIPSNTRKKSPVAMETSPQRTSPNSLVGKTRSPNKKNKHVISRRETVPMCINTLSPDKKDGVDRFQITPIDKPIVAFVNLCSPVKEYRAEELKVPTPVVAKKMNAFEMMMMNRSKENSKRKSLFSSGAKY